MSYTPTEWKTGDVVTADKLNNIEHGIIPAIFHIIFTWQDGGVTCDKTYSEILEAYNKGQNLFATTPDGDIIYQFVGIYDNTFFFREIGFFHSNNTNTVTIAIDWVQISEDGVSTDYENYTLATVT